MKIRRADLGDVGGLVAMGVALCEESPVFSRYKPDYMKQYRVFAHMVLSDAYLVLVADDMTAMLVAHVEQLLWFQDRVVCDDMVFVKKEFRGTSRAVRLMRELLRWSSEQGVKEVRVGISTGIDVGSSIGFYEKLGFQTSGALLRKVV